MKTIYLAGSLGNLNVPSLANEIEALGTECFADWFSPGSHADTHWRDYAKARGLSYGEALQSYAATHIYEFDLFHLDRSDAIVLLMPAGRSAHLEFGYMIGRNKPGFILFDGEPERWDVMYQFATAVFFDREALLEELRRG